MNLQTYKPHWNHAGNGFCGGSPKSSTEAMMKIDREDSNLNTLFKLGWKLVILSRTRSFTNANGERLTAAPANLLPYFFFKWQFTSQHDIKT